MLKLFTARRYYRPGETVRGHVEVHWRRRRRVRGIHVSLIGSEETEIRISDNHSSRTYRERNRIIGQEIRVWGQRRVGWMKAIGEGISRPFNALPYEYLPAGLHRFPFSFTIPSRALPSFNGSDATVKYGLKAEVDVPLGRNRSFTGSIKVIPDSATRLAPIRGRRKVRNSWLTKVFSADLELRVRTKGCPLVPDTPLEGVLKVTNRSRKRIRGFTLILRGREKARAKGHESDTFHDFEQGFLKAPDPAADRMDVNFGILLPHEAFPYRGRHSSLSWRLVVEIDVALGFDARIRVPLPTTGRRRDSGGRS